MRSMIKNPKETLNRYSTLVRQAMSDKYVECKKRRNELFKKQLNILHKLDKEKETLPYQEYVELQREYELVERKYYNELLKRSVWDQAREICMECADEVFGGDFERFIDIWNSIPEEIRVSEKELERLLRKEG